MMSYRDRWFCAKAETCKKGESCNRRLTPEMKADAERKGFPVEWCVSDLECFKAKAEKGNTVNKGKKVNKVKKGKKVKKVNGE